MRIGKLMGLLFVALSIIGTATICPAQEPDDVLAKGDDLTVTRKEMSLLQTRLKTIFKASSEADYCLAVLRAKLFATEARRLKLDENPRIKMLLEQVINDQLSLVYQQYILTEYPLSEEAVESYYYSHQEEFKDKNNEIQPLNDDMKRLIKQRIMSMKRSDVMNEKFDELKKKYKVDILDPICEKSEGQ